MSEFVRVRLPNKHEVSLNREFAESEGLHVLEDEPATDLRGRPLPATRKNGRPIKPRVSVDEAAAKPAAAATPLGVPVASNTTHTGGDAEGGTSE